MERRAFLLALASLPALRVGSVNANAYADAASDAGEAAFAAVRPGVKLVFPLDHGAHPDFRTEWWYATGWLSLPDGSPLGFQITFFRVRTGIAQRNPSAFAPRQLILAHAAIADPRLGRLHHDQRVARVGFGRAGFETTRTGVWVGDWRLDQFDEHFKAEVRGGDFSYSLTFIPHGPPLLHGVGGFSVKAPDPRHASYYYSCPQLEVKGTVTLGGRQQAVTGRAWLDHEWSSELLPQTAQGWDWLGVNLDDGGALMAFRLRTKEQTPLWTAATFRSAAGEVQVLSPEAVAFDPVRHWRSTRTGIAYPVEWRVRVGPRTLQLSPLIDDQELDSRRTTGAVYWEGAVRVTEGSHEVGRGYLEMTGYGERIQIG